MTGANSVARQVRQFIVENFLYGQERPFGDSDSFLAEGIVDSTGVLQLVAFLEETYGITVADEDLTPENLDSVDSVAAYLNGKLNPGTGSHASEAESVGGKA